MKKLLITLLVLFVLVDIFLAFVFFGPKSVTSPILKALPKNCKVVDSKYCKTVIIEGKEDQNETILALFSLPKGAKVYAPVDGKLNIQPQRIGTKIVVHELAGTNGSTYFFAFEPLTKPFSGTELKAGDEIGAVTGRDFPELQNHTLGVGIGKGNMFDKKTFDSLFR